MRQFIFTLLVIVISFNLRAQVNDIIYREQYRPQLHFSPKKGWVNDPNGMVFYKGIYHLFFQHYPHGTTWGPMHWGHTTSSDLVHWQEQPIALYPDSLGYIFSGSAVVDKNNTSGFGKNGIPPLVAIFTHHDTVAEKKGATAFQHQSLAYSLDSGKTWAKYNGNPVLKNPGITDFRDPKVTWFEPLQQWIMTLAAKDRIVFYASPDLKSWTRQSEFGQDIGAHGGVWECPDLFTLNDKGKETWVLIVSINPGGPNKGSATQYFVGDFNGKTFTPVDTLTRWLDYGPDQYAGITWSNTGDRKIFIGWMSNWMYANNVPSAAWRNAMTIPRALAIKQVKDRIFVKSEPVAELQQPALKPAAVQDATRHNKSATEKTSITLPCRLDLTLNKLSDYSIILSNDRQEQVVIGYNKADNVYYIDRVRSGETAFHKDFAARHFAPRLAVSGSLNLTLVIDVSSVELFADDGLSVMTALCFPSQPFNKADISTKATTIDKLIITPLQEIWN